MNVLLAASATFSLSVRGTTLAANGAPTDADLEVSDALGPVGGHLRDLILGVGGTGASIRDGIGDDSVGTAMRPLDPMLTVLIPRSGAGDGRLRRFTAPGSPARNLVEMGWVVHLLACGTGRERDRMGGAAGRRAMRREGRGINRR